MKKLLKINSKMKIATIVGARPQFIKAAVVSKEIKKHTNIEEIIIHTGQHFDENMSDIFFREMQIPLPNYNLEIHSLGHGAMTGQMLEKLEQVIQKENPDLVLIYGDTNSTLAGALAASKLHYKVAHIEAGLRSFNMWMPEEINRIIADRLSNLLFCPTSNAIKNLEKEGFREFPNIKIVNSGDVMYDAALFYSQLSSKKSNIIENLKSNYPDFDQNNFILATVHRVENTDDNSRLSSILEAFTEVGNQTSVVFPVHPRTRKKIEYVNIGPNNKKNNIIYLKPIGYFDMIELLKQCKLVMTDSGGLQKEAYFFNRFCITLRDETEWIELFNAGVNVLVGAEKEKIIEHCLMMKEKTIQCSDNLFGDGKAGSIIVNNIIRNYC